MLRIFDKNLDGYIDKKEFKWMTNSKKINNRTIDLVFEASLLIIMILVQDLSCREVTWMGMENWTLMNSKL